MRADRFVGVVLVLTSIAHLHLLATDAIGPGEEPGIVLAGHALALPLAVSGAIGAFRATGWAWKVVLSYGFVVAALILSLRPALQLPARAWVQLVPTAVIVLGLSAVAARGLRRRSEAAAGGAATGAAARR